MESIYYLDYYVILCGSIYNENKNITEENWMDELSKDDKFVQIM